jgi:hypothetical protein
MATSNDVTFADGETPELTAHDIYGSLQINHGTQILLCIAWCTDKQRRLLALFPESASSDVIFKTNNEKRPSLHICSKTARNETFGGFYSFLASQASWSFDYTWGVLVPAIVDPRFIARNCLITTDNDNKLYGPYKNHIITRYINGKHRLCTFHGITQGWPKNKITTSHVKSGAGSDIGHAILEAIKTIVMSWTTDVESAEELQMSYECLMHLSDNMQHFCKSQTHQFEVPKSTLQCRH